MGKSEKPRILVVDDDSAGRYVTSRILQRGGFEVVEAGNGTEALLLAEQRPDLVLLDVNLPDINGREVCKRLKTNPHTADLPVLHLSASCVRIEEKVAGLEEGADGYLVQPVEAEELIATIKAFLRLKASEQALRDAGKYWQSTFDAMNDAVCLLDADMRIIRSNKVMDALCGIPPQDLIGKHCWDVLPETPEAIERMKTSLRRELAELKLGERWFDLTLDPVLKEEERMYGAVHVLRDITDRKAAELAQEEMKNHLQQAQKMESIGLLAGGVAHDFNNMLGVILGHTELAQMDLAPSHPVYVNLVEIHKAAARSAALTRQLLAFARKQTVVPKVLNLNATVTEMLTMLKRLVGEDTELKWEPAEDLWQVKVDPIQIDQILANLCVNAQNAIAGNGKLSIRTENGTLDKSSCSSHHSSSPGEYVLLSISDNGHGMDKETLTHIFEPFFTTKKEMVGGGGIGLGLATVYGIVKQNNGFIDVTSEPGQGTSFTVFLPRHLGKPEQAKMGDTARRVLRGHETILLVDDEPAILEMTRMILVKLGYTVMAAKTPSAAVRLASEHSGNIQLLISDVRMPEMNGPDLAQKLQSLYPHLKCMFMSGYADVVALNGVLDEGVCFIQKPFSSQDFSAKIREALGGNR